MQERRLHVDAVLGAAVGDEGSHQIDHQCHARNGDHRPSFDGLRIGEAIDRFHE